MLNYRMKRNQVILFILTVICLFALNKFVMNVNSNLTVPDTSELINHEHVSSQKLFDNVWLTVKNNYYDPSMNHQSWSRWKEHYHGKIKTDADAKVAIDTMLASLDDPYSRYMDKSEYNDQNTSINSKITGIGVNIASISGKVHIINVMDGTPAQAANLQAGDVILDIDGKEVNGLPLSEVANLVRGTENTFVQLTILRNKDKFIKKVMRKEIAAAAAKYPGLIIIGSGGNINKLYRLADEKDKEASTFSVDALRTLYESLKQYSSEERRKLFKLKPDRAEVIVPAAEIFLDVAKHAKSELIWVPTIGLADGIIDSLYTRNLEKSSK